jgi:hypothetical protein
MSRPRRSGASPATRIAALSLTVLAIGLGVATGVLHLIAILAGPTTPLADCWLFNTVVAVVVPRQGPPSLGGAPTIRSAGFIAGGLGNGLAGTGSLYTVLRGTRSATGCSPGRGSRSPSRSP